MYLKDKFLMSGEQLSLDDIRRTMRDNLNKGPLDIQREQYERRLAQEEADRIAANIPNQLWGQQEFLRRNIPDALIDQRIDSRRKAEGIPENTQTELPAQRAKARVNERTELTKELLTETFGPDAMKRYYINVPGADWHSHVADLNLNVRDRVDYEAKSTGYEFSTKELNEAEAIENIRLINRDGSHGPSDEEIKRHIATARQNGNWPPPELHSGPGSTPRPPNYSYTHFKEACTRIASHDNSRNGHTGNSSAVDKHPPTSSPEVPYSRRGGPLRTLQARQPYAPPIPMQAEQHRVNDREEGRLPQLEKQRFRDLFKGILKRVSNKIMGEGKQEPSPEIRATPPSAMVPVAHARAAQDASLRNANTLTRDLSSLETSNARSARAAMIESRSREERGISALSR
jgi:hypothetical protein